MMQVNADIWRNLITNMFILEVVGSVSIGVKMKKEKSYVLDFVLYLTKGG
jgi:hypothetical protein